MSVILPKFKPSKKVCKPHSIVDVPDSFNYALFSHRLPG